MPPSALEKGLSLWKCYKTIALVTGSWPRVHLANRVQQMGVITADRISSSGQKAAARMQCQECSEQPCHKQGRARPRLQHHNPCAGGTGQSWLSPQGLLQQGPGGCGSDCHTPFQPHPHSRGSNTGFPTVACRCLGKKFTKLLSRGYTIPQKGQGKSNLCFPQKHSITDGLQPFWIS